MSHFRLNRFRLPIFFVCLIALVFFGLQGGAGYSASAASATTGLSANDAFTQAASEFHVPVELLKGLCYMEGRLSMHNGAPSIDSGYGCMHLIKNKHADTLDQAANDLHANASLLQSDLATNIRGGAAVLRDTALSLSSNHTLPANLARWYGAVAAYSHATARSTATMYADALYKLLNSGFSARTDRGETVTLAPQHVTPDKASAASIRTASTLPAGCTSDSNVDYPGAIDCIVDPSTFDCNISPYSYPDCTYVDANRPSDYSINAIVIHDIEGTAQDGLNVFQDHTSGVSIHYVVGTDGTIYQCLHEKDVAYQVGNLWENEHSIGIEHAGYDATGYQWYNATEYLASAKLVAYLLKKYNLPLDRDHVVAHGTIPSPNNKSVNHVDPGPYWLWDYYFGLIHQQGVSYPSGGSNTHIIKLAPATDQQPDGSNGTETTANFNFFYLYTGPSTLSAQIPQLSTTDITDESGNVEPGLSYYYITSQPDSAGSGDTMYEIWYGEFATSGSDNQTGALAWLAVPPGAAVQGRGTAVKLSGRNGKAATVYGDPIASSSYVLGSTPAGSIYASGFTLTVSGSTWYEINFNHRQAWVPASEVTLA